MPTKTRSPRIKKVKAESNLPITITLKLAGQDQVIHTDNVFKALKEMKIDRLRIKSSAQFWFAYNGKEFMKTLFIPQVRRFVGNNVYKMIVAKWVNQNLGIAVTDYN